MYIVYVSERYHQLSTKLHVHCICISKTTSFLPNYMYIVYVSVKTTSFLPNYMYIVYVSERYHQLSTKLHVHCICISKNDQLSTKLHVHCICIRKIPLAFFKSMTKYHIILLHCVPSPQVKNILCIAILDFNVNQCFLC